MVIYVTKNNIGTKCYVHVNAPFVWPNKFKMKEYFEVFCYIYFINILISQTCVYNFEYTLSK